jgi:16S rRNA C1402 (ribose-2'-O) methylase RsmI
LAVDAGSFVLNAEAGAPKLEDPGVVLCSELDEVEKFDPLPLAAS